MCGITGYFTPVNCRRADEMEAIANSMADAMQHRGPDSSGTWVCPQLGLALAHRRLSIIDLSVNGNQPMQSEQGRYTIVFNGEIYNHPALRDELASRGRVFRGSSDTEVILTACEEWGVEQTINRCVGMFALALYDRGNRCLYLTRDRIGEKPLYYGWHKGTFLFASELKAMRHHPDFQGEIDRDALSLYFRHRYIPAPYCIYRNTYKLRPGTILKMWIGASSQDEARASQKELTYWSLKERAEEAERMAYSGTAEEAVNTLETLLKQSIEGQMIADVPLGAFLSGGIDSSTVVALMQSLSTRPVNTFCIGFEEEGYNEAVYAKKIARHLGCSHTELYVTPRQALDIVPSMARVYDEPFADVSQLPTLLLSQLTRRHVTVSLSGDGGDELFYGYKVYRLLFKRWRIARRINIRSELVRSALVQGVKWALNSKQKQVAVLDALLGTRTLVELYRTMVSVSTSPCDLVLRSCEPKTLFSEAAALPRLSSEENAIMSLDALSYLPDDILVKVDRAAMACSLETRIPLLDHRIVEFAFRLPFRIKFRGGETKWPLREILYRYVPRDLVERPKKGFGVPIGRWLRHELSDWVWAVLDGESIGKDGVLNGDMVRRYLNEHMSGTQDHSELIWSMLMFQCWLQESQRGCE